MIRVEIKDFQSLEHVTLQVDGFTALAGRSNLGKSAVIRAIKYALTGGAGAGVGFVRHNPETCLRLLKGNKKCKCQAQVRLTFEDGKELLWEKGDAINQYTMVVDGKPDEVYNRIGTSPELPPILRDGFAPVKVGDHKELVQISDQWRPLFLVNANGAVVADVLSDVANLDDINQAMRDVTRDRKEAVATRKIRDKDILKLEKAQKQYEILPDTQRLLESAQALGMEVETASARFETAKRLASELGSTTSAVKSLKAALEPPATDSTELEATAERYIQAQTFMDDIAARAPAVRRLKGVSDLVIPEADSLQEASERFQAASQWSQQLDTVQANLDTLAGVANLDVPASVYDTQIQSLEIIDKLTLWQPQVKDLVTTLKGFKGFGDVPELTFPDFESVLGQLDQVEVYSKQVDALDGRISTLSAELDQAVQEEKTVLQEFADLGVCPSCSQRVNPEHLACGGM